MPINYDKMSMEELLAWIDAQIEGEESIPGQPYGSNNNLPKYGSLNTDAVQSPYYSRNQEESESSEGIGLELEGTGRYAENENEETAYYDAYKAKPLSYSFDTTILEFNSQNLLKGILFSEILGKPRSKRPIR